LINLISRPEIRQLRQRVVIYCHLEFLTAPEVESYIARRLFVAGDKGRIQFTRKAKQLIAKASSGTPRLINQICDYALTSGYICNDFNIGPKHVKKALAELVNLDVKKDSLNNNKVDPPRKRERRSILFPVYGLIILMITLSSVYLFNSNFIKNKEVNKLNFAPGTSPVTETNRQVPVPKFSQLKPKGTEQTPDTPPVNPALPTPDTNRPVSFSDSSLQTHARVENTGSTPGLASAPDETATSNGSSVSPLTKTVEISDDVTESVTTIKGAIDEVDSGASFILQLGSFKTIGRTITAFYQYNKRGIETRWNQVDLGEKGTWYRLFTGRFETKTKAIKYKNGHGLDESMIVFAPWTVLVSESAFNYKLDPIRSVLNENVIDYFTIKNKDGNHRLLTGAFVTNEGAQKLAQEIIALGYEAKVVLW